MLKQFILKSKKIYAILGTGIVICLCILSFRAGEQVAEKSAEYSEEYLTVYGTEVFAWSVAFSPDQSLTNIQEKAKRDTDNYFWLLRE